jgi:hypothetical protein
VRCKTCADRRDAVKRGEKPTEPGIYASQANRGSKDWGGEPWSTEIMDAYRNTQDE